MSNFKEQAQASLDLIDKRSAGKLEPIPNFTPMQELQMRLIREADIDKLTKLMDLEERWRKAEALMAYNEAMAKFKSMPLTIKKNKHVSFDTRDGSGGKVDYWHATLASICEQACPLLASCGLRHHWNVSEGQGGISVTCYLTHELGHSENVTLTGAPDASGKKNAIQQKGSTVTYLERYTFLAVTGLATIDQDNDGRTTPAEAEAQMDEGLAADLQAAIDGSGDLDELQRNYFKARDAATAAKDTHAIEAFANAKNKRLGQLNKAKGAAK